MATTWISIKHGAIEESTLSQPPAADPAYLQPEWLSSPSRLPTQYHAEPWIADVCGAGNVIEWKAGGDVIQVVLAAEADAA